MAADGYYIYNGTGVIPAGVTRVRIHESVTVISADAFCENPNIEELECHHRVKKVGREAFYNCPSLRRVRMPGVEVVEGWAFANCYALTIVECSKLERIEESAFEGCEFLRSINLSSAKIVKDGAFSNCAALTNIKFGDKLERIEQRAFVDCTSLERITLPLKDGMITDDDTFQGCKKLVHVDLVEGEVLRDTIDALLLEEWRNDMKDNLDAINQSLPTARAGGFLSSAGVWDAGEKAQAVQLWIRSVLHKIIHYKAQHQCSLNKAATTLQLDLPNDIPSE